LGGETMNDDLLRRLLPNVEIKEAYPGEREVLDRLIRERAAANREQCYRLWLLRGPAVGGRKC
jgi:hypothetical protein